MIRHVQEIDFRNCNLKSIPLAMSLFDEKVKVRLEGNPLSGFSGNFLFYDAEKVIKKLKEVGETRQAKWDEVRLLIVGDAAVGLPFFFYFYFYKIFIFISEISFK